MKDQETINRFVELRAQGWSFARLAAELNVCKQTLINWSRKYQFEVQNQRVIAMEALQEKLLATAETRALALAEQLRNVESELAKRNVAELSTAKLFALAGSLRRQIAAEIGPVKFTVAVRDIPADELCEEAQTWKP